MMEGRPEDLELTKRIEKEKAQTKTKLEQPTYLHYLGAINDCMDKMDDVIESAEKLIEVQGKFAESVGVLGDLLAKLGNS